MERYDDETQAGFIWQKEEEEGQEGKKRKKINTEIRFGLFILTIFIFELINFYNNY